MSFDRSDFSSLTGIAIIEWDLQAATPLCIKSGTISMWKQAGSENNNDKGFKLRRINSEYDFFKKQSNKNTNSDDSSISDFYYNVIINKDKLKLTHEIPSSSVRGALRNYAIKRLTEKKFWNASLFPEVENSSDITDQEKKTQKEQKRQDYSKQLKQALKTPGWQLIKDLFGLAVETGDDELENEITKGRFCVETGQLHEFSPQEFQKNIFDGNFQKFNPGPTNGKMIFTTRNPIDRITHGAKDKGLHSFTELAPGNSFKVCLRITNPKPLDLSIVALWEQGIKQGLLRIGGLNSAGRGRLELKHSKVNLFLKDSKEFNGLEKLDQFSQDDILNSLYTEFTIPEWQTEHKNYLHLLQKAFNNFQQGA